MDRAEKQAEVDYLKDCFSRSQIALCADYRGLTVAQITNLRKTLRKSGCYGKVVKNTLAKLAIEKQYKESGANLERFLKVFEGPSLVIFSYDDPVAPTKVMTDFVKGHEAFKIKGAWLDGAFVDAEGVQTLSKLPGREETLAKLLALIAAPATQLVRLLQAPSTQIVRALDAHRENLEKKQAA